MRKTTSAFTLCLGLVLLGQYDSAEAKTDKKIKIKLEVANGNLVIGKDELFFETTPADCTQKSHDNCYDIPKDHVGEFTVKLEDGDNDCNDVNSYRLSKVVLGMQSDVSSPMDKSSPPQWGGISRDAASDFNADATTGEVSFTRKGSKSIEFEDQNDYEFAIWYKIEAEHCSDSTLNPTPFDPRIDNKGTGSSG